MGDDDRRQQAENLAVALGRQGHVDEAEQDEDADRRQRDATPQNGSERQQKDDFEPAEMGEIGGSPFGYDRKRGPKSEDSDGHQHRLRAIGSEAGGGQRQRAEADPAEGRRYAH